MTSELVTLIPPGTGGVRDYAEIMRHHIPARILAPSAQTALAEYGSGQILLNFSGYGYHPRGIPSWLVDRLAQLRARGARIGIFFHELFASEPPWRSAFWLGPRQRRIAADLGSLADFWLTNCEMAAHWLRTHSSPAPHRVLAVYSNVGEPATVTGSRAPSIVVFGGPAIRSLAYQHLDDAFWQWVRAEGLAVHDIGPPIADAAYARLRVPGHVQVHGTLPAAEVSRLLSEARYGLVRYPPQVVAKSGVFAAYCAHGVCPILLFGRYETHDGLVPNRHYAAGVDAARTVDAGETGAAALAWYQPHRVQAHADAFKAFLAGAA